MNAILTSVQRLAQLQRQSIDKQALQMCLTDIMAGTLNLHKALKKLNDQMQWASVRFISSSDLDPSHLPCLAITKQDECLVLKSFNAQSEWVMESAAGESSISSLQNFDLVKIDFRTPFDRSASPVWRLIKFEFSQHKRLFLDACISGFMLNILALVISFYSMHVYDRVVPTGAVSTLLVLSLGAVGAVLFEWLTRAIRADLHEKIIAQIDQRLGREVFLRFLNIRLDTLPKSVGSLAGQMKAYESVRSFLTNSATQMLIDAPFAIIFLFTVGAIAGWIVLVPLIFLVISIWIGLKSTHEIEARSHQASIASMRKTGLLVESIEGAETLKSGQGGWRQLSVWQNLSDAARSEELKLKNISESAQHSIQAFQQIAYIGMVAVGALMISRGELSMGSLIACTILSGRILQPVAALPSQLIQWGYCKSALQGLDQIWQLPDDHHAQQPIVLQSIQGEYRLKEVTYSYNTQPALQVPQLQIQHGEKIGVLGPIGSGKTTLLRLLSGMYKPQKGEITLDGVALTHIGKPLLSEQLGYLQQEGRLFEGTLRDNLLVGILDPGDDVLKGVAIQTGLHHAIIAQHPLGFDLPIFEGGQGLSGGQRQLVNLTRVFLRKPRIWLLDEPTASMDKNLADHVTKALQQAMRPQDTLVLVTHKPEMLTLVDRLVVIANHQIVLDGPKEQVIQKLQA
jgi:ATP-binding cassette, subfamily C, bacterial LapB